MEGVPLPRPAVVAQFGVPLAGDVEVDAVLRYVIENGVDGSGRQVFAQGVFVAVNIGLFHLRLWCTAVWSR